MIIVMSEVATEGQIEEVVAAIRARGLEANRSKGLVRTVVGVIGPAAGLDERHIRMMPGVVDVVRITESYRLASRVHHPSDTVVSLGDGVLIGGRDVVVMAGPCSVENEEQLETIAAAVRRAGALVLRGGAFKPRTSPYSFQGLGESGLRMLRETADRHGLKVVSEVMETGTIDLVSEYVDMLQVGARNMQNFPLLKALGGARRPVLLKRSFAATIEEWLLAAEYVMAGGNERVVLCERGIRTFENVTRNTLDVSAVPVVKKLSHLPVVVDPSHGTGQRDRVVPMARAAVAAGADGLLIEVHHAPETAMSDGAQSIYPQQLEELFGQIRVIASAIGRSILEPAPIGAKRNG